MPMMFPRVSLPLCTMSRHRTVRVTQYLRCLALSHALQNWAALSGLALTRGSLVRAIVEMPQEGFTGSSSNFNLREDAHIGANFNLACCAKSSHTAVAIDAAINVTRASTNTAVDAAINASDASTVSLPHHSSDGRRIAQAAIAEAQRSAAIKQRYERDYALMMKTRAASPNGSNATSTSSSAAAAAAADTTASHQSTAAPAAGGGARAAMLAPVDPPSGWPSTGALSIRNLSLRYSPDGPLVLQHVSLDISAGERVAIVGRTGSGKVRGLHRVSRGTSRGRTGSGKKGACVNRSDGIVGTVVEIVEHMPLYNISLCIHREAAQSCELNV